MGITINITLFFRIWIAFMGLLLFLVPLIHFIANGFGDFNLSGIQTQDFIVTSMMGLLMFVSYICTILSPFFGYIPFPLIRRFGYFFSPQVVIPWFAVHGCICLFMTGYFGLVVAIFCFITVILGIAGIFLKFFSSVSDDEE